MGLISSIGRGIGGILRSPLGGSILKAIPGVGTAVSILGAGLAIKDALGSRRPSLPPLAGSSGMPTGATTSPGSQGGYVNVRGIRADSAGFGRRRRMNAGNAKAMRRAARRLEAGEKLFKKIFQLRHGHAAGHVVPKGRKRRSA